MIAAIPLVWRLGAGAALALLILAAVALWRQSLINDGWDRALQKVEKQNGQAVDAARRVQRSVDECYDIGGLWSQITGQCSR